MGDKYSSELVSGGVIELWKNGALVVNATGIVAKHPRYEYMRAWAAEHKEQRQEYSRKRHEENPEERRNNWAKWYAANKVRKLEYDRRRHAKHPEIAREKGRRYNGASPPSRPCPRFCECCGRPPSEKQGLCLDHCHDTGKFRGWLCGACNRSIGQLGDNLAGIQKALDYLKKAT